ncbi:MAG: type ISP restriction/modification enzyme [bacterium]
MKEIVAKYLKSVSEKFSHEETSEMGYRADFEILLKGIFESIKVKRIDNDPKANEGNRPDFILYNEVPILYIETKDIGVSLDKVEKSEQMARYFGYANLVLTDYLEFRFYRNGKRYNESIKIATYDLKDRVITLLPENYEHAAKTLLDFAQSHKEPIKSGEHLAKIMGGKAQRIRDNILHYLTLESEKNGELVRVYEAIKKMLVHDLTFESFADMYAQTLVYGLFVARYYDETSDTFSRQEARDLVPASNPFLRHFFDHIAGPSFDKRLSYIVDELCVVFLHSNIKQLLEDYLRDADPVIHFYEDFLREYDPELRKRMGAYYTPLPVVNFIVRSVDHILKNEFGLAGGLADTSKLPNNKHRVQILDPAVGTGTFISAAINLIYGRLKKQGQDGRWPAYVHNDLLPRLHGFELMMTPYTIAHLKLSLAFKKTGFWKFHRRLGIYLTNSLEAGEAQQTMFSFGLAESIAEEAKEASKIKNEMPIMVVIGNPPYSGVSSNETDYANSLVAKYKVEPGGKQKLQERKHWLNDDYVKFIAFAEDMIAKNGEGVVGFITNHGYLDNPTFRGMRWHLMDTFDSIYVIDLHGNAKKKEVAPDGSKDENVFAIQQGVAIMLAVKTGKKKKGDLAKIYRLDIWGDRENKFKLLNDLSVGKAEWVQLESRQPNLVFASEGSGKLEVEYQQGFNLNDFFVESTTGVFTLGDGFIINMDRDILSRRIENYLSENISESTMNEQYDLGKNYSKWIAGNKKDIIFEQDKLVPIIYRPFDRQYTYFDSKLIWRPRIKLMTNFLKGHNLGLAVGRQGQAVGSMEWNVAFVIDSIVDLNCFYRGGEQVFPLYIFKEDGSKSPNFKKEVLDEIEKSIGAVSPENILDYIYAVLHSPAYRTKFKEFLKSDFPRVPYPNDAKTFKALAELGTELRSLHLLESPKVNNFITTYPVAGTNATEKIAYKDGKVFINKDQYFGKVPEVAWHFYIGGYQPAQKWLKDRKGRTLTNSDIEHYQKIIVALTETDRIMGEIDNVGVVKEGMKVYNDNKK